MQRRKFFKNLEKVENKDYETLKEQYLKENKLIDAIKPTFKKVCYSSIRVHLASHILLNSIENLNNDIVIYKTMTKEQKYEVKFFKTKILKIFNQTSKIMNDIS